MPAATRPMSRRLRWLTALAVALVVAAALVLQTLADRWWPATVLMFAPRWPWVLPLLALLPALLWRGRRLLPVWAAGLGLWAFGVMGVNLPLNAAAWGLGAGAADLRVASYNMGQIKTSTAALAELLGRMAPDVMAIQECDPEVVQGLKPMGWQVATGHGSCLVSRHPIAEAQQRDQSAIWAMGGSGVMVRYGIDTPGQRVVVVNLHLETVRKGLSEAIARRGDAAQAMTDNLEQRSLESLLARQFTREAGGPLIVTGDFNMPVESALYRRDWADLTNAFHAAGWGTGATKHTRWHGIRIDHVLTGPGWQAVQAEVGPDLGGDHRPMVVDLRLSGAR